MYLENRKTVNYQLKTFKYAFLGIVHFYQTETKALIHSTAGLISIILGWYFSISSIEWLAIVTVVGLVIFAEIFNTAIERMTDLVAPEHHPLAGQAKDLAAGAVLVMSIISLIVGVIIFLPKIMLMFN